MTPLFLATLVALCTVGGAAFGLWLRKVLPEHHVNDNSKDVIRVAIGLIVTMTSLMLSLALSSAKTSFSEAQTEIDQTANSVKVLNHYLQLYGPQAEPARQSLHTLIAERTSRMWPEIKQDYADLPPGKQSKESLLEQILALTPANANQSWLKSQSLDLITTEFQTAFFTAHVPNNLTRSPFVMLLCFWMALIFTSFGLFAPSHLTGKLTLLCCALSVTAAIFLIMEMEHPHSGFITISPQPFQQALVEISR